MDSSFITSRPGIFGNVTVRDGILESAKVLKLRFFLRYDTVIFKEKSSKWIQKVSDIQTKTNITFYSSSNPLTCSNVEFDFTDIDVTIILPISFFIFFVCVILNRAVVFWLLVFSSVCLSTLGIISYIQISLLKIMALVLVFLQGKRN